MLTTAHRKYRPAPSIPMGERLWPQQVITQAPRWCSVDLRDGNQALPTPMNPQRKSRMFQLLTSLGFREIEAGFPAASKDDYDFLRQLTTSVPEQVAIQVLTTARREHIERTFAALQGMPQAIVHFYISTSPLQRRLVFGVGEKELIQRAVEAASLIYDLSQRQPETRWSFEFSPESFSATEPEFALEMCEAVGQVWQSMPPQRVIFNLPATVEVASPNRYADQIEWFHRHFSRRQEILLSIHPHNDRGCAVAAAELALLAGADRVEGALFGNGERTGNLDLVTLAMNLHAQGIDCGLDFSHMGEVVECYRHCTGMEVHPRHPYAGELVFTAFSGSHQDAIRKGLAANQEDGLWQVPYLPVDPRDVGAGLELVIRVNSQSGKAGAAHLLQQETGIVLPKWLEPEFARLVQETTEQRGVELTSGEVANLFHQNLCHPPVLLSLVHYHMGEEGLTLTVSVAGQTVTLHGTGTGPLDAACQALALPWSLHQYEERAMSEGSHAQAIAFIALMQKEACHTCSGVAIHENIVTASLLALLTAVNRAMPLLPEAQQQEIMARWLPPA
ncbi:MAG: 2-isopropylmalate synthase [Magnetococcales bacterium]|nr:2-isopropylmalate synthase [Magnetococcales bacterium]NGZ27368.1 2-isopropylmalate synthase [Magnetococcales bacterium]